MWFFVQLCSSWQYFNWLKGSRGLSAAAELLVISTIPHLQQWKPRYKCVGKWKQRNNAQSSNYQLSQSKIYDILLLASAVMMNFWMMQNFSEHCATTFYKRRERRVKHLRHIHVSLVDSAGIDASRRMNNDKKTGKRWSIYHRNLHNFCDVTRHGCW